MNKKSKAPAEAQSQQSEKITPREQDYADQKIKSAEEKANSSQTTSASQKKQPKSQERSEKASPSSQGKQSVNKGILQFLRIKSPQKETDVRWQRDYSVFGDDGLQAPVYEPRRVSFTAYLNSSAPARTNFNQALDPRVSRQSLPLQQALLNAGVDSVTARSARRTINAFMDTPAYYRNAAENLDDYSRSKLRQVIAANAQCAGVTSLYLSGRAFYGLAQLQDIDFVDTLRIYDEVDYEAPTPLFAESDEESSDESESSVSVDSENEPREELVGLTEQELYYQLAGKLKVEADDLGQDDGFEQKGRSIAQIKQLQEFLCKHQDVFDYPVQQMCPDGLRGQKSVLYCFSKNAKGVEREDIQIVPAKVPDRLKPLFINVGERGADLQQCFDDQDYIVEYERDEVDE